MAFTCGFFNSVNGDRRYNSRQISQIFDGIIVDGVFAHYGTHFEITPLEGMEINVGEGRFWFNHVWGLNDGNTVVHLDPADVSSQRKDAVIIEIDESDDVRNAFIKVLKGDFYGNNPTLINTDDFHQYPLAYVTVPAGATAVDAANIQVVVGTSECPFATGVLENVSIDNLFNQWDAQFQEWFSSIQGQLEGDVLTNLVGQIEELKSSKASKEDVEEISEGVLTVNGKRYKAYINDEMYGLFYDYKNPAFKETFYVETESRYAFANITDGGSDVSNNIFKYKLSADIYNSDGEFIKTISKIFSLPGGTSAFRKFFKNSTAGGSFADSGSEPYYDAWPANGMALNFDITSLLVLFKYNAWKSISVVILDIDNEYISAIQNICENYSYSSRGTNQGAQVAGREGNGLYILGRAYLNTSGNNYGYKMYLIVINLLTETVDITTELSNNRAFYVIDNCLGYDYEPASQYNLTGTAYFIKITNRAYTIVTKSISNAYYNLSNGTNYFYLVPIYVDNNTILFHGNGGAYLNDTTHDQYNYILNKSNFEITLGSYSINPLVLYIGHSQNYSYFMSLNGKILVYQNQTLISSYATSLLSYCNLYRMNYNSSTSSFYTNTMSLYDIATYSNHLAIASIIGIRKREMKKGHNSFSAIGYSNIGIDVDGAVLNPYIEYSIYISDLRRNILETYFASSGGSYLSSVPNGRLKYWNLGIITKKHCVMLDAPACYSNPSDFATIYTKSYDDLKFIISPFLYTSDEY